MTPDSWFEKDSMQQPFSCQQVQPKNVHQCISTHLYVTEVAWVHLTTLLISLNLTSTSLSTINIFDSLVRLHPSNNK